MTSGAVTSAPAAPRGMPGGPRGGPRWSPKVGRRLIGVVFLLVLALLAWLSVALYSKQFTPVTTVTLYTSSVGNEMHIGAQVMVRGVQVGEVRAVSANGTGARLELALQPPAARRLPVNVTAEMLPTTLFGERYVDLIPPPSPSAQTLTSGSVISQDRSHDALELQSVLDNLLPMLRAVEPDKLGVTLTAIGQGLQGRGAELGQTLVTLNSYLGELNPKLPTLDKDIKLLAGLARTYRRAAPDLLQALNDFGISGQTIASEHAQLAALFTTLTAASDDLRSLLSANQGNIIHLSTDSTATLSILARYSPEFPCTLSDLVAFEPAMDKVLGAGTSQPGLHVHAVIVPSLGRYRPGRDAPVYGDNLGPHCYSVPFRGIRLNDGTSGTGQPVRAGRTQAHGRPARLTSALASAGLPGAPQQAGLARELAALALGRDPSSLPGWSSLLAGPLWQGTDVTLKAGRT
jgi:phospholipid/cholesterol/gamma-HCH transport system substrate-binding protein